MHIRNTQNAYKKVAILGPIYHLLKQVGVKSKNLQLNKCPHFIRGSLYAKACHILV